MLTKVIEQAKIDHFTKWFERADKIVIVSHVSPDLLRQKKKLISVYGVS